MRLRNEVTQLRSSNQALVRIEQEKTRLEEENRKLRTERRADPVEEFMRRMSREEWAFHGYGTPERAYVSGMWALKEGQIQKMIEAMTPEEQERFKKNMEGKSEEEMAARFKKEWGWVKGLRVVEEQEVEPGEKILTVYLDGPQPVLQKVRMNQVGNEWKAGAPVNQNEDPMAFYRKNPELMKRYFPNFVPTNEGKNGDE